MGAQRQHAEPVPVSPPAAGGGAPSWGWVCSAPAEAAGLRLARAGGIFGLCYWVEFGKVLAEGLACVM